MAEFIHKLGLRGGAKFVLMYLTAHVRSGLSSRKIFHVYGNVNMLGHAATVVDLCGSLQTSGQGQNDSGSGMSTCINLHQSMQSLCKCIVNMNQNSKNIVRVPPSNQAR